MFCFLVINLLIFFDRIVVFQAFSSAVSRIDKDCLISVLDVSIWHGYMWTASRNWG